MAGILTGDHKPPTMIEVGGVPEIYADLVIARTFGDMVRIYCCREIHPEGQSVEVAGVLYMPLRGALRSRGWVVRAVYPPTN